LTDPLGQDLTLKVKGNEIRQLSFEQRKEAVAWFAKHLASAPECVRSCLEESLAFLTVGSVSQNQFNIHWRQLGRAFGFIPSSEKRRSGALLETFKKRPTGKPQNERERLEQEREQSKTRADRYADLEKKQLDKLARLEERLRRMSKDPQMDDEDEITIDTPVEEIELSEQSQAESAEYAEQFVQRLEKGNTSEPSLQSSTESLMNGSVVSFAEEDVSLKAKLPEDVREEDIVKTLTETRVRYDFSVSVTRLNIDVEKKIVMTEDGNRQVFSASTSEYGPPRYAVTWQALATLAVMVGQFAMPLNRLATMLSTAVKRFTAGSLSRMAHYVAERLAPIYIELCDQLADSEILSGDDTSCRVVEVSSYFSKRPKEGKPVPSPWSAYRTIQEAEESYAFFLRMNEEIFKRREEGDREAKRSLLMEPSLRLLIGRELTFESQRRDNKGAKQSLNTTVITGRSFCEDPQSMIVFYRSHLGSLGNLLEMLLKRRKGSARKLTIQADLSTANLVTDPNLTSRFEIELAGCASHARRPFALYEDQDPLYTPYMLHLFKGLAMHEDCLDRHGRNYENVLAVRGTDSRRLWDSIKEMAQKFAKKWSKETPLGAGARYILKHFEKLTAYLRNPRLEWTNNLRERLLRTEKLIEKSSMFRRTIEGRVVLDILRTILQTAVAAGVPAQEYLVDVMRSNPKEILEHPERYTPRAWAARQKVEQT